MNFSIGDRVVIVMHPDVEVWDVEIPVGSVGTVAGPLERCPTIKGVDWCHSHRIDFDDGRYEWFVPQCLQKLEPPPAPREEVGEWELCPWKPGLPQTVGSVR